MHSLIHHPQSAESLRAPAAPFPNTATLPGLRAHFPSSLPIRLPAFRPTSSPTRVVLAISTSSNNSSSTPQDLQRHSPSSVSAPTLAPLRFIIPSSHCSNSSMNHAYSSSAGSESVSFRSVAVKAEPKPELQPSQSYAQANAAPSDVSLDQAKNEEAAPSEQSRDANGADSSETAFNGVDDDLTADKKTVPKRARAVKNSNRSTKSKARPGLRKGKWTDEESRYATQLTNYFKEGLLPIERGTMLRLYLSQKLNCEPMRITKKFTGGECIGKQVFRPCSPTPESRVRLVQAQLELVALEAAFIKKLKENREEAPGDNESGSSAESDSLKHRQPSNKNRTNGNSSDDEGFTSESSTSSPRSFSRNSILKKGASGAVKEEDDADNANAVGLLLDFFYKANRNEKSDGAFKCSAESSAVNQSFESGSAANSPTKRIRALSISSYVNDDSLAKRSRVGSLTTVFAK